MLLMLMSFASFPSACAPWVGCHCKPMTLVDANQHYAGMPYSAEVGERNVIGIQQSGDITWNHFRVASPHGSYSELVKLVKHARRSQPQLLTVLEVEEGAPCGEVERIRQLMIEHLRCAHSQKCFEGQDPRLPLSPDRK